MSYMGVDLGTSGCKVMIINDSGEILASVRCPYQMVKNNKGFFEISPFDVLTAFKKSTQQALSMVRHDPVEAIAFAAIGEAFLLVGDDRKFPLSNIFLPMDFRGLGELPRIRERVAESELYNITGQPLHPMYSLPKILWLKHERLDLYRSTSNILCVGDFLIFTLTGCVVTDYSAASRTMCFDIKARDWSSYLLSLFDLDRDLFPVALPIGSVVAPCRMEWQEELDLSPNTLVVTGGFDQVIAAIGGGVIEEGILSDSIGTTECFGFVSGKPLLHQEAMKAGYQNNCFIDNAYFINGGSLNGAVILNWLKENIRSLSPRELAMSEPLFKELETNLDFSPSPLYFLPYFSGKGTPYLDPRVRGALFGLDLSVSAGDILKAFLESSCFETMSNVQWIEKEVGYSLQEIRAFGGGSKSDYWLMLKSEILGRKVSRPLVEDTSPFGAAILAMAARQELSIHEVVKTLAKEGRIYNPKGVMVDRFQKKYKQYLFLAEELCKLWSEVSKQEVSDDG